MKQKLLVKSAQISAGVMVLAQRVYAQVPTKLTEGAGEAKPTGAGADINVVFRNVANTLIFIVGAIAVIMLIIGGLRYVLSSGNKEAVEGAKNTILYAIIGIIVAILAFAAVQFVLRQFGG